MASKLSISAKAFSMRSVNRANTSDQIYYTMENVAKEEALFRRGVGEDFCLPYIENEKLSPTAILLLSLICISIFPAFLFRENSCGFSPEVKTAEEKWGIREKCIFPKSRMRLCEEGRMMMNQGARNAKFLIKSVISFPP